MKAEMEEVAAKLAAGEDFGELVEKHSDCPERGGDLGYFPRGQMVPSFEEVVFEMEKGQTSGVFATEFGWHIAKVTDRVAAAPCPLEQAREVVERQWRAEKEQRALEQYVDAEKAKATIEERDE